MLNPVYDQPQTRGNDYNSARRACDTEKAVECSPQWHGGMVGGVRKRGIKPTTPRVDTFRVRTVLAHEWLLSASGSDKVAAEIVRALDVERVITAAADPVIVDQLVPGQRVDTLWTDRLPGIRQHWMRYAPAIMAAWSATKVGDADLLISNTHFAAKAAGARFDGRHISLCHSPMRYAWRPDLEDDRLAGISAQLGRRLRPELRRWDRWTARSVDLFVGNSQSIAKRIEDCYDRPAVVLHPPCDVDRFAAVTRCSPVGAGSHYLCFGRLVAYKRADLAVEVCTRLDLPLVVAGRGPELARLKAMAGPTVLFEEHVSDDRYFELLSDARALLFPGEEDFGIVPVEAMAAGVPVIAFGRGGAVDTVVDGVTGVLFAEQSASSLADAIDRADRTKFDLEKLRAHADGFRADDGPCR